jgi:hypothetical protein
MIPLTRSAKSHCKVKAARRGEKGVAMKRIGVIDYFLDQYHAEHYPAWIAAASGGGLRVACAWAMADKPGGRTNKQCCERLGIELCDRPQEVIENSDCLIVMSPDNPEMHEELCRLPLASGKPTYVDKAFAPDRETAQRIIEVAENSNTPFFSTSALRYAREYGGIKREKLRFISSRGPGAFSNYGIHQVEPIIGLMGAGVDKVMFIGAGDIPAFVLRFSDGRCATLCQPGRECCFSLAAGYSDGQVAVIQEATDYYPLFIEQMVGFFGDGKPRVPAAETLQVISVLECGRKAMAAPDEWIAVPR